MKAFIRKLFNDRHGTVAIMAAGVITGVAGLAALSVDIGNVARAQQQLQNTADLAAMAGAANITAGTGIATANAYSAVATDQNASSGMTVTMASGYPVLKCFTSTGVSCGGSSSANAIVVKQQATVPLYFAPIFGINSVQISATSTAGAGGGKPNALDVMIILDTTASMNTSDANCSISNATREDCALAGVRSLLSGFWPSQDQVGLMVFPGLTNSTQVPYEYDCSSSPNPAIAKYSASPVYQIIALSTDYKTSDSTTTLNTNSNLVKAVRGGASGCTQGLTAVGGVATFYADAITAAQNTLTTKGRSGVQKVIILLSDGDANASSSNMPSAEKNNQCHEAITAAQTATTAGTWVYSIAYGASTSATPSSCATDSPAISACSTMQQIASDSTKFYADTSGGSNNCTSTANSISELVGIFQNVGSSVTVPRLLPNNTT